jgi:hypothetical protein
MPEPLSGEAIAKLLKSIAIVFCSLKVHAHLVIHGRDARATCYTQLDEGARSNHR